MYKRFKHILLLSSIIFLLTGCCYVNNASYEEITNNIINNKRRLYNNSTVGFKYYLPRQMSTVLIDEYNLQLKEKDYIYYMYTDLVSYYNKKNFKFEENDSYYYSKKLDKGLLNIVKKDDKYIIKLYYNYASIEVETLELDLKEVLSNCLIIAKSIKYNDDSIKLLIGKKNKNENEEVIDIFHKDKIKNDYLEYDDTYKGDETIDYDPDVIN